ncbi:non-specific serine/threonine protein kinase [Saccharothrix tamanrassetensis]|uniref:Non-specific serine/threonine protein kinase n=1 Tax=Saccharothrix tamanrassetensis TaxID=1051531 RepID=A0A841CNM1_9PSEU|nr:LuxR C-terminal-related transcriptional regulator [Saccharothrix tamanrassetensis]MBB5957677.1 non-specific serine/threonine protein kinase [Saccharothrix tamanrassetensis]
MTTGRTRAALPASVTELVGRDALVAETAERLRRTSRMVTLAGPGGVGKTALALEVARECRDAEPDREVAVAHLGDATRPDELGREVVRALGIADQSCADPLDVLVDFLRDEERLLVLDNCEQLREAVGDLCAVLLEEAPGVRVLATSRQYLGIAGEHTVLVPPLSTRPDTDRRATGEPDAGRTDAGWTGSALSDAMRLLLRRAEAAGRRITADDDWDALGELVDWSSGLPLVLELVAVRLGGGMAPREILDRLDGGRLLATRTRRVRPHHRTLEQTLDWSYGLCSDEQQRLLARVSVFAGGFSLRTAEKVCSGDGIGEEEVMDLLADLVAQSLVMAGRDGRYHQLQPVREYGQRRLRALGEEQRLRDAHFGFFRGLAAELATTWYSADEVRLLKRGYDEMPNFRAALNHCAASPDRAGSGLALLHDLARLRLQFFFALLGEFRSLFRSLLALTPVEPTPERIGSSALLGWIMLCQGSQREAGVLLEHCRELVGDRDDIAPVVLFEGAYAMLVDGDPRCIGLLRRAVELFGGMGPEFHGDRGNFKLIWALAAGFYGDEATGIAAAEDYLAEARAAGAQWAISWALWARGLAPLRHGAPVEAVTWFRAALELQIDLREQWGGTWSSEAIAWALAGVVEQDEAASDVLETTAELLGAAVRMQKATGVAIAGLVPFRREREKAHAIVVARLGAARYQRAYDRGMAMANRDSVYALALSPEVDRRKASDATLVDLSPRQREIALLVSQGHPNHEIARRLHLSVSTVENHLTAIYAKVAVTNRVELGTWVGAQTGATPR